MNSAILLGNILFIRKNEIPINKNESARFNPVLKYDVILQHAQRVFHADRNVFLHSIQIRINVFIILQLRYSAFKPHLQEADFYGCT